MKKFIPCILLALTFVGGNLWADETADQPNSIPTNSIAANDAVDTPAEEAGDGGDATTEKEPVIDSGNTAWILTASALVLFMTIPGLSFFYAGLVRKKNVLSVLMHCFAITCVMTLLWVAVGYSGSFAEGGNYIGSLSKYGLMNGVGDTPHGNADSIPPELFFIFQMTFFIITPALMVGAFVERIRFSAMLLFTALWALIVYVPACHMVWGGGIFGEMGVQDFAGGIVVHITAGFGALVACIVLGPRKGYPDSQMMPHNLPMTVAGTGMLWVGWFGFNGGSAVAADGAASTAIVVTQISAATAALTWMAVEWLKHGKPSVLGIVTGSIAGLAAITPASGVVGPQGALIIGLVSGFVCWYASTAIKAKFKYDDSLDVFGVHGVGGIIGTLLLAFLGASGTLDGRGEFAGGEQFVIQLKAAVAIGVFTIVATWIILKVVDAMVGLRVDEQDETSGLDISSHGEAGYND